jgi:hypothetical protein
MLEVDLSESKRRGKVYFRKTWHDHIMGNAPWIMIYVWVPLLIAADVVDLLQGRGQLAFHILVVVFLLFTLLILWGHRRTGRLQTFSGRDIKTNKEIVRTLCQELGWAVNWKRPHCDIANIPSSFLGLPYLRRAVVLYDQTDILVSVISYNILSQPGPDLFPFDSNLTRSFGKNFLEKLS